MWRGPSSEKLIDVDIAQLDEVRGRLRKRRLQHAVVLRISVLIAGLAVERPTAKTLAAVQTEDGSPSGVIRSIFVSRVGVDRWARPHCHRPRLTTGGSELSPVYFLR